MTKEQMVMYLANVAMIAAVDGELNPSEAKAIESIRQEIGATKAELQKALTAVAQGGYKIFQVGRFSDQVRNLEDMIVVSLKDGVVAESEKSEVLSFAKSIKITRGQITEIFAESKARILLQKNSLECVPCGKKIPSNSKFCPHCGVKVQR